MDIKALQHELRNFAAARNWQPFHTPKNLSSALMVEAAELVEIFQWLTPEQSQAAHLYPATKERIADEVADVLLYLLQVADHCAIDLPEALAHKWLKNAAKHPPAVQIEPALTVSPEPSQPPTHVFVDWENVQPKDQDILQLVPDVTDVWVFHGQNQKNVAAHQALWGQRVTLVPVERPGKNALDFHLSFYIGYVASRSPKAHFVVISNDLGYGPMLEHARTLGFSVQQIGFQKTPALPKKAVAQKAKVAPAASANNALAASAPPKRPAAKKQPVPAKKAPAALLPKPKALPAAPSKPMDVTARKTPTVKKPSAASKAVAASKPPPPAKAPATKKTRATATKAVKPATSAVAKAADAGPKPLTKQDHDKALRHVCTNLQKMANKPNRKSSLLAVIKSLLQGITTDANIVGEVMADLEKTQFVVISDKGHVSFPT